MFFCFYQNNSHGTWAYYKYVIIEAEDADEANEMIINESYNYVYFDKRPGDCTCCGPRWNKVTDFNATENPRINGIDLYDPSQDTSTIMGPYFIIYKDLKMPDGTSVYANMDAQNHCKYSHTKVELEHDKKHAPKGQGGSGDSKDDSKDSKDGEEGEEQEDADSKDSKENSDADEKETKEAKEKAEKLAKMSAKEIREAIKQLGEAEKQMKKAKKAKEGSFGKTKGFYEQRWDD